MTDSLLYNTGGGPVSATNLKVTPTGGTSQTLGDALAASAGSGGPIAATTLSASSTTALSGATTISGAATLSNAVVSITNIGTVDPHVAGQLFRNSTTLMVSVG